MKKLLVSALIAIMVGATLTGCGNKKVGNGSSVEQVLQDKIGSAFYPEEQEVAENAKVEVNGNLVSLFIVNSEVSVDAEAKYAELIK